MQLTIKSSTGVKMVNVDPRSSIDSIISRMGVTTVHTLLNSEGIALAGKKTVLEQQVSDSDVLELVSGHVRNVKVFDPINKKPYNLRYGGDNSEIQFTSGIESHFHIGGNKRIFLCKKYQARQCRSQGKCNSIHADRRVITKLRQQNPVSEIAVKSETVIDVRSVNDNEKFQVSLDRIQETAGSIEAQKGMDVILCSNHQKGVTCPDGSSCKDIHVESSYLRHLRSMWKMPCCGQVKCTDTCTVAPDSVYPLIKGGRSWRHFRVCDGGKGALWQQQLIAPTKGLKEICESTTEDVVTVPMTRVCRPHQRKMCKWGNDCNNVHVCRSKMPPGNVRTSKKRNISPPLLKPIEEVIPEDDLSDMPPLVATPQSVTVLASPLLKFQNTYKASLTTDEASPLNMNLSSILQFAVCC
eukprot:TRINITY_DN2921_c0_g1_i1.p1 TRINITY_DN2921_c0_g1~~TRINITY_DN2921_c0_g1_i1.p1  ORF type:complete len:411 (+),score=68.04 TRINITY_DN2921_c0_g1_i1:56-1288(+)